MKKMASKKFFLSREDRAHLFLALLEGGKSFTGGR
jgi:hypothetical protein